jgi:hypothetical protein
MKHRYFRATALEDDGDHVIYGELSWPSFVWVVPGTLHESRMSYTLRPATGPNSTRRDELRKLARYRQHSILEICNVRVHVWVTETA